MASKSKRHIILMLEIFIFAAAGVATTHWLPITDAIQFVLALLAAYAVPKAILLYAERRWNDGGNTPAPQFVLLLALAACACCAISSLHGWLGHGGTLQHPCTHSDETKYFIWALHYYEGSGDLPVITFPGFPLMMVAMWKVLGVSVLWPMALNIMFTMLSVVTVGLTTQRALHHRVDGGNAGLTAAGMLGACLLCFYLSHSTQLLKEPSIYFAVALAGYVMTTLGDDAGKPLPALLSITLWTLACVIAALVRATYVYFLLLAVALLLAGRWRAHRRTLFAMGAIAAAALLLGNQLADFSLQRQSSVIGGGAGMQNNYILPNQQPYLKLLGYYFYYPVWLRLLLLPLTAAVQFVIPFPWVTGGGMTFGNVFPRIQWGWYAIGGTALYYYLTQLKKLPSWLKHPAAPQGLGMLAWWVALCFLIIAYVIAGAVSRYVLPFEPLFIPVAIYVWHTQRRSKGFKRWGWLYVIVLLATLAVCFVIQSDYMNALQDHYDTVRRIYQTIRQ